MLRKSILVSVSCGVSSETIATDMNPKEKLIGRVLAPLKLDAMPAPKINANIGQL
jgi:hypothetical protein